jgi:two-component system phosphate regulon response regulator OmpR
MLKPHLLVVDDDLRLRQLLVKFLTEGNFDVTEAANAAEAYEILETFSFDLMVLDIMMPGETGMELTERLRRTQHNIPILLLTAMGEVENRIKGFQTGADEYLVKPFEPDELLLRIKAILRRTRETSSSQMMHEIAIGPLHFHMKKGTLRHQEQIIPLTDGESKLLKALAQRMEEPISREELVEMTEFSQTPRAIDVQITRLRKKIEEDPKQPKYLQTIRHKGYVLWAH